ncbi:MAG: phospholipase D family protein [Planctomycetota bacterium]
MLRYVLPLLPAAYGCATSIESVDVPRTVTRSLPAETESPLGRLFVPAPDEESLFAPVDHGGDGLDLRLGLAHYATSSIDVQSYLWHPDACGAYLLDALFEAADRGVRVRLLIDGFRLEPTRDHAAALALHPNVEIRVFNPTYHRGGVWEIVELVENLDRLDHRMHNKLFLVDGVAAVFGGRNVGDEYFGLSDERNMRDFDLFASGRVVEELATSFDDFWNSRWSIPVMDLSTDEGVEAELLTGVRERLTSAHESEPRLDARRSIPPEGWFAALERARSQMVHGRARVLHDVHEIEQKGATGVLAQAFVEALGETRGDVVLVSAYLVPNAELLQSIRRHTEAGERVLILTNSYASTNQPLAHTFYAEARRDLIEAGAELYEMRADAWSHAHHRLPNSLASSLCLHTKSGVFGPEHVLVGSMNLDPRSMDLNTELGVLVESADLAARIRGLLLREFADRNAWRVTVDADGDLVWSSQGTVHRDEPDLPTSEAIREWFVRLLPVRGEV